MRITKDLAVEILKAWYLTPVIRWRAAHQEFPYYQSSNFERTYQTLSRDLFGQESEGVAAIFRENGGDKIVRR